MQDRRSELAMRALDKMKSQPILWFIGLAICLLLAAPISARAQTRPAHPNVLFIVIDDLNDWVGCLGGHPQAKTPNIDRLAARGTLFVNAHCQAPLCNPSRSSVMTGLRPSTTGIYALLPGIRDVDALKDHVTLPQYFSSQGYFTFTCGKVYHDGSIKPKDQAREFNVWGPAPGMPLPKQKFVHTPDDIRAMDWGIFPERDEDQADWKIADAAIAQLKDLPAGKPFFVACGFRLPHVPCFASQKWFDLFPEDQVTLPLVKADEREGVPPFAWYLHWKVPEPRLSWLRKSHQWTPLVRSYLACTTFMDSQVGRLVEALDASGQADNTVIVLWSDNGWHLGEKAITGKNSLWEQSTHVPLLLAAPGLPQGARCRSPAELLDIYPTLVELCGLPARPGLEGHSLVPQLKDAAAPRAWPAITTSNQNNHAIRTDRWRYIRYADGSQELYDLRSDAREWKNLAGESDSAGVIAALAQWLPKVNADPVPGSAARLLVQKDGIWYWEGKAIDPAQLED
jgi:arylsulfatase A-like enzyme